MKYKAFVGTAFILVAAGAHAQDTLLSCYGEMKSSLDGMRFSGNTTIKFNPTTRVVNGLQGTYRLTEDDGKGSMWERSTKGTTIARLDRVSGLYIEWGSASDPVFSGICRQATPKF